ncbi:hypothetical protein HT031_000406 [Scenedesmus sp. PABB004]|nr:hypothetical protein HT031_000406 [Scenedesmus sp. PABB004]
MRACLSGAAAPRLQRAAAFQPARAGVRPRRAVVVRAAQGDAVGPAEYAGIAAGLVANPVCLWSEYTLKTTGAGLPPGPGGALGALEGVSYLVVVGIIAWSVATKARTGSGLPAGPAGLLGAVEGFSYLSLLGAIVAFGLTFAEKGALPGITG